MAAENNKKLNSINQKIADLQSLQKKLENDFIQNISKDIAKIIAKKKAYNIDKPILLKKIESVIDEFNKSK